MVRRHELADESWVLIAPLPGPGRMGRPVRGRRQIVDGILWKPSAGAARRDLPERYGPWKTVRERFRPWSADGAWDRSPAHVQQHSCAVGQVDRIIVCVDSTTVRARQHAAGPEEGPREGGAPGRSRGELTSRIHLARDRQGRPLASTLTGGNVNDRTRFEAVVDRIEVIRPGPGGPRTRPDRVVADKGQSARKVRAHLRGRGIDCAIPERVEQIGGRIRRGETRCRLDEAVCRRRNVMERCFNRLKRNRDPAARHDERARRHQAMATLTCFRLRLP
ncbi:IS5 family transposase [Streptomyces sp. NPDC007872]|uniref:IS5 family transposase n=1 Tax=Streptomyces sp. NPDC007872 TaxID=3364782 RepID=UPI00368462DB